MNRVSDFYSKSSGMSAYPIYRKAFIRQRGGEVHNLISLMSPSQRNHIIDGAAGVLSALLGLGRGYYNYQKYKKLAKKK